VRHTFEVLASRTVYTGRIMALRVDDVGMPGGGSAIREVIEHPGAVAIAAIDDDERVVLVHQYRHPLRERLWELPAGLLDVHGEDPTMTARRELAEETGLAAADYLARGLSTVDRLMATGDEEADLEVHRVPLADAVRQTLTGEIVNSIAVGGILAAHLVCTGAAQPRPVDAPWPSRPTAWASRRATTR
jgi:ADP-ribose pyrophosphatase